MARTSITVGPDAGPEQTVNLGAKKKALQAISQIRQQLGELERLVRSMRDAPKVSEKSAKSKAVYG